MVVWLGVEELQNDLEMVIRGMDLWLVLTLRDTQISWPAGVRIIPTAVNMEQPPIILEVGPINRKLIVRIQQPSQNTHCPMDHQTNSPEQTSDDSQRDK